MKKNLTELPRKCRPRSRALADKPDEEINTDDVPEILDWSGAKRGMFYRPVKRQITLRLDADVVAWFKARADGGPRLSDRHQQRSSRACAPIRKRCGSPPARLFERPRVSGLAARWKRLTPSLLGMDLSPGTS